MDSVNKKALVVIAMSMLLPVSLMAEANVTRATLKDGLRVVIIRNPLAPVVSVYQNYMVGEDETPPAFPGMAHAQEHMAFRGCSGITADQTAAIFAQLGGENDANTQQNITQYLETVSAQDLNVALHIGAACMQDVSDSESQWDQERGAIEQEVASDLSDPEYKLIIRLNHDIFRGTPYEHDPLGTKASFDATTGAMLKKFYTDWYAPNNAILVIAGNVDPRTVLAEVNQLYGGMQKRPIPSRPKVRLQPVTAETFTMPSDYPYILTVLAFRFPGTDSPDYASTVVLADVLASQRGEIYALVPAGKALDAGFQRNETYRKASMAIAYASLPEGANAALIDHALRKIVAHDANTGLRPRQFLFISLALQR